MLLKKVSDKEVKGTVIAGDQIYSTCAALGLNNADKIDQMTFPASCSSYGDQHGDVFCTNLDLPDTMTTLHPCFSAQGQNYALSDHAIYVASVKLTNFSI